MDMGRCDGWEGDRKYQEKGREYFVKEKNGKEKERKNYEKG